MGMKGSKLRPHDLALGDQVLEKLSRVGDVSSRRMFGGVGIFEGAHMFAIISNARLFFRTDDRTREKFVRAGCEQHGRMPYLAVPTAVVADRAQLEVWAREAVAAARAAHRPKARRAGGSARPRRATRPS